MSTKIGMWFNGMAFALFFVNVAGAQKPGTYLGFWALGCALVSLMFIVGGRKDGE